VLRWTDIIARTNTEMAYLFASQAPEGLRRMALADIEAWDRAGDGCVRRMGLFPRQVFREVAGSPPRRGDNASGITFENISSCSNCSCAPVRPAASALKQR